jgi:hypothetical protein
MRKVLAIMLTVAVLGLPVVLGAPILMEGSIIGSAAAGWCGTAWAAGGHDHHDCRGVNMSEHTSFEIDGDLLVVAHRDHFEGEKIIISEDGDLTINGDRIETDGKSRKLLKKFYREAVKLEENAERISADAEEFAEETTAYAAAAVRQALRSLRDGDDEEDEEARAEFADLEADFEEQAEFIERLGDEIGDQADLLKEIAEVLRERIPELDQVEWFLDS